MVYCVFTVEENRKNLQEIFRNLEDAEDYKSENEKTFEEKGWFGCEFRIEEWIIR